MGDAECEVLFAGNGTGENNDSVVLRVVYGECEFLFMGDAEQELEMQLVKDLDDTKTACDFIKIGHHGSKTSTSSALLEKMTPSVAVISCGEDNSYGFPNGAVLERLESVGATCYRTDLDGTLVFWCDGEAIVYQKTGDRFFGKREEGNE